jgi:RNA polymerase sigma-70 factor (ECF subfamily)
MPAAKEMPSRWAADLQSVALRAGRGDSAALSELVRRTSPTVWRACAALVDPVSADDLTQDTFLRAVRSLPGYRGDANPMRWLLTIARRVCAEEIARRQRARATVTRLKNDGPCGHYEPMGLTELADGLNRLSAERREAFVLTAVAGLSYAEAAEICGCPIGTIRSRVARARTQLIDSLTQDDADAGISDAGLA